jgi:hypothetical protein
MKVGFITFAGGDIFWRISSKRIVFQAKNSKEFVKIKCYKPGDLKYIASEKDYAFIADNSRGFGYWLWKPIVVLDFLLNNPGVEAILYADAGCDLNFNLDSKIRWHDYLDHLQNYDCVVFKMELIEKHWTKEELFLAFPKYRDYKDSEQILGGVFLMTRDFAINFCEKWLNLMRQHNYHLLVDDYDKKIQIKNFKQHRHDQSFFSLLVKSTDSVLILESLREVYFESDWKEGREYPIWTSRNKSIVPKYRTGKLSGLLRMTERILKKILL